MTKKIIEIKNLTYRYPNQTDASLKNINLTVNEGEWVSLIGANGSGKSTLAKLIVGLLETDTIRVFNQTINQFNGDKIRNQIGMVFQNPENQFVSSTVMDDVAFGLENQGIIPTEIQRRVLAALKIVDMETYRNDSPHQLSGGQMQRVALAGVIAQSPKLIILDEATSMLDPITKEQILTVVRQLQQQENFTVLAITHDINETTWSDKIILLNNGEIKAQLPPKELYEQTNLLKDSGVEIPLGYQIQQSFRLGTRYLDEQELIEALWKLN